MSFPKVKMEGICHLRMTHLLSFLFFKHTTVFNASEPLYLYRCTLYIWNVLSVLSRMEGSTYCKSQLRFSLLEKPFLTILYKVVPAPLWLFTFSSPCLSPLKYLPQYKLIFYIYIYSTYLHVSASSH